MSFNYEYLKFFFFKNRAYTEVNTDSHTLAPHDAIPSSARQPVPREAVSPPSLRHFWKSSACSGSTHASANSSVIHLIVDISLSSADGPRMVRTGGRWNRRRPRCHVAETLAIGSGFPHLEAVFSPPAAAPVPRPAAHGRRPAESPPHAVRPRRQIGRASCRERVCQHV